MGGMMRSGVSLSDAFYAIEPVLPSQGAVRGGSRKQTGGMMRSGVSLSDAFYAIEPPVVVKGGSRGGRRR
jgi:hypothetical protein